MTRSKTVEKSVQYFRDGLYCSEAILKAFNEEYALGLSDEVYRMATGFGAGMGASGCSCGAVTGGVMVLSLVLGRESAQGDEGPAFAAVARLHEGFRAKHRRVCCRVLTKPVEWGSPEHHVYCERFVRDAAAITERLLKESGLVRVRSRAVAA